jgi:hypothetical protein
MASNESYKSEVHKFRMLIREFWLYERHECKASLGFKGGPISSSGAL